MLSEIMRKCCTMLAMLFKLVRNHEKVLSHGFRANPWHALLVTGLKNIFMFSMLFRAFAEHGKAREAWRAWGNHGLIPMNSLLLPYFLLQGKLLYNQAVPPHCMLVLVKHVKTVPNIYGERSKVHIKLILHGLKYVLKAF